MNFIELNNYFILCYYIIQRYKNHKQLNIKRKKTKDKKKSKTLKDEAWKRLAQTKGKKPNKLGQTPQTQSNIKNS